MYSPFSGLKISSVGLVIFLTPTAILAASVFFPYAQDLVREGIIQSATDESQYRLDAPITRAETVKIAINIAKGSQLYPCSGTVFRDVDKSLGDLCGYIEEGARIGMVSRASLLFRPNAPITRAELTKILFAARNITPSKGLFGFLDVPSTLGDLRGYIHAGVAIGCIDQADTFRPYDLSSRGEAFKIASCTLKISPAQIDTYNEKNTGMTNSDTLSNGVSNNVLSVNSPYPATSITPLLSAFGSVPSSSMSTPIMSSIFNGTHTLSSSGNILTSSVSAIVASGTIINSSVLSLSGTELRSTINGVGASVDLTQAISQGIASSSGIVGAMLASLSGADLTLGSITTQGLTNYGNVSNLSGMTTSGTVINNGTVITNGNSVTTGTGTFDTLVASLADFTDIIADSITASLATFTDLVASTLNATTGRIVSLFSDTAMTRDLTSTGTAFINNANFSGSVSFTSLPSLPLTLGSLYIGDSTNTASELSAGSSGQLLIIMNGTPTWVDRASIAPVLSVFGRTGSVIAQSGDYNTSQVPELGNLYFTTSRARNSISGTGMIQYDASSGVIGWLGSSDDVPEGVNNLYWTQSRFLSALGGQKGIANGIAGLDANAKVPLINLPGITINTVWTATTQAECTLYSAAVRGDVCIASSDSKSYILSSATPGNIGDWLELLNPTAPVSSINGVVGNVNLVGTNGVTVSGTTISLSNITTAGIYGSTTRIPVITTDSTGRITNVVETTIPTATASQLGLLSATDYARFDAKQDLIPLGTTGQYYRGDKAWATLDTSVVPENINLYFTPLRAQDALSGSIDTLQNQINTLSGNLTILTNTVNTLSGNLATTNANLSTLSGQTAANTTNISNLSSTVTNLTNTVNTLSGNLNTLTNTVNTLSGQTVAITNSINSLSGTLTSLSGTVAGINTAVNTLSGNLTNLTSAVNTLSGNLAITNINLENLSGALANTNSTVSTLSGQIASLSGQVATLAALSHEALTLGTANGLSLSGQQLSLSLASMSTTGALSVADWSAFTNKWSLGGNTVTGLQNLGTNANFDLPFVTHSAEKMRLFALANPSLGIGRTTLTGVNGGASAYSGPSVFMGDAANISGNTGWDFIMDDDNNATNSQIRFRTNGDGALGTFDIMTIDEVGGGRVGIGNTNPSSILDISGAFTTRGITLANFAANGSIGTAATTVDISSYIIIPQTTPGVTLTLPNPTLSQAGRYFRVSNTGTTPVIVGSSNIPAGAYADFLWTGIVWQDQAGSVGNWSMFGNANTNQNTNFLGTTNGQDLVFRANNVEAFRLLGNSATYPAGSTAGATKSIGDSYWTNDMFFRNAGVGTIGPSFNWLLTNDAATMYAYERSADSSDYTFKMIDNAEGDNDRFVFWQTSYLGTANDKWPIVMAGNTANFYPRYAGNNHITGGLTANSSLLHLNQTTNFVGIKNTAPGYTLHVGNNTITSGTAVARFENAGGTCTITPNVAGGVTCTSDINRKKDIIDVSGNSILSKMIALDVKSYHMLTDASTSERQIGFIAQNLEQYFPWLVNTDSDGKKEVNYGGMTPIIVAALQEIVEKLADITERIDQIFDRVITFTRGVIFEKAPIYTDKNVAGFALIAPGATEVKVTFDTPYETLPVVTISSVGSRGDGYIDDLSERGFTIRHDTSATRETRYSWFALVVRDARTVSSDGSRGEEALPVEQSAPDTLVSTGSGDTPLETPIAPVSPSSPMGDISIPDAPGYTGASTPPEESAPPIVLESEGSTDSGVSGEIPSNPILIPQIAPTPSLTPSIELISPPLEPALVTASGS